MDRRDLLTWGGLAALAAATGGGAAAQVTQGEQDAHIVRLYADEAGESYVEDLPVSPDAGPIPTTGMRLNRYAPGTNDWHTVGRGTFAINTVGELEVEVSTGAKRVIGPGDLVFIHDTHGKGHVTRLLTPVTHLFITVPEDFDVLAWASGAA